MHRGEYLQQRRCHRIDQRAIFRCASHIDRHDAVIAVSCARTSRKKSVVVRCQGMYGTLYASMVITSNGPGELVELVTAVARNRRNSRVGRD
jgi:hypothetical protein